MRNKGKTRKEQPSGGFRGGAGGARPTLFFPQFFFFNVKLMQKSVNLKILCKRAPSFFKTGIRHCSPPIKHACSTALPVSRCVYQITPESTGRRQQPPRVIHTYANNTHTTGPTFLCYRAQAPNNPVGEGWKPWRGYNDLFQTESARFQT